MPKLSKLKMNGMQGTYSNIFMTHIYESFVESYRTPEGEVKAYLNL